MTFINRKKELAALEDEFAQTERRASMAVIYGRRRIGKTELIKNFINRKPHIYFLATLQSKEEVVENFSHKAAECFHDAATMENPHTTWDTFFKYLVREIKNRKQPIVLAFDEFTYLIQQDPAISSVFQYYWDEHLKDLPVMLILCGSYVGMMEKEVLSHKSPLYGRRTIQIFLEDIRFQDMGRFFPKYSKEDMVVVNAVLGGVPSYLLRFDPSLSVMENIAHNFLDKRKALFADGLILLREELKEPRNYLSILKAISYGKNTQKEIADHTHLEPGLVGKYLDVLRGMKIVSRIVPVTERNPEKSKRGIYQINDHYYNFWLRFVFPYADYVEEERSRELMENIIKPDLNAFVGRSFERLARGPIVTLNARKRLPFVSERIGPWWSKEHEIDYVGFNRATKEIIFIEVKWAELGQKEVDSIISGLKEKAQKVDWNLKGRKEYFCLIAKRFRHARTSEAALIDLDALP